MSAPRRFLERLGRFIVRNPAYKILSITVALMAWLYVQGTEVVETTIRARVVWNLPEELATADYLRNYVALTIGGPRNATRRAEGVRIPINLQDIGPGEHSLDFSSFPVVGLPPNVQVLGITPSSDSFVLDEVARRKVRVEVEDSLVGELAPGWMIASMEITPPVVPIRGPRMVVEDITAVPTETVDISDASSDFERWVDLDLPRGVRHVGEERVRVRVTLQPEETERTFSEVPVRVWNHQDWTPTTDAVEVVLEGPAAAMGELEEDHVAVFVHLPEDPTQVVYDASHGPREGLRLRVLHGGGEGIRVRSVTPDTVRVVRP